MTDVAVKFDDDRLALHLHATSFPDIAELL